MSNHNFGHNGGPSLEYDGGWVAIWRSVRTHPVVGFHLHATPCDDDRGATQPALAWIDLIMDCRYTAGMVDNNGKLMRLERGQLLGATSWLAKRWNWTPKAVRVWLDKLENHGMISFTVETTPNPPQSQGKTESGWSNGRSKGRFANVLTICNYGKHQFSGSPQGQVEGQDEGHAEGRLTAGLGQVNGRLTYIENARAITKEQLTKEEVRKEEPLPLQQAAVPAAADEFSILNGTAEAIISFIGKSANVPSTNAKGMLRSNIQIYGGQAVNEAYALTLAQMAAEPLGNPYRYFLKTAEGIRDKKAKTAAAAKPSALAAARDDSDTAVLLRLKDSEVGRRWIADLGEAGALAKYRKHTSSGGSANA